VSRLAPSRPARADTRRGALLAAAQRVIQREGFAGATVGDITREAGASLGLLNYHFSSKDEVLAEAFAELARRDLAELEAMARREAPPAERLAAYLDTSEWADRESWRMWIDAWGNGIRTEALRDTLERFARAWRGTVAEVLADGQEDGTWSCDDPEEAAARLVAALDGIGVQATLHPDDVPPERASAWARRLAALELGIALPDPVTPGRAPVPAVAVEVRVATRARDLDAAGRVHHAALLALLEEGRSAWLDARLAELEPRPELVVASLAIDVEQPAAGADKSVIVRCALGRLRADRVRTEETVLTARGGLAARARATLVALDRSGARRPLGRAEREALSG
jgi:AcrR family transcriptional regulator/acyl-CoA thioesterase FadM